ncbi:MAG: SDR family oxidoreductase, partial [Desulfomonilaceae bacterium]
MDKLADAIMLIYQEGHILTKPLLNTLLKKERAHLEVIESILEECVSKGMLRSCNVRVVANLIKSMVDAWVLKRWDLRGYASALDMEKIIIDLLFQGLAEPASFQAPSQTGEQTLEGKSAIVVNGGTVLSTAVISFLLSRGVTVAAHMDTVKKGREYAVIKPDQWQNFKSYLVTEHGPMTPELFRKIEDEVGPPDIYIHDTGVGALTMAGAMRGGSTAGPRLRENVACAQDIAGMVQESMCKRSYGRVIYLAPWAWDRCVDPLSYDVCKASVIALTTACARQVARFQVNVNCIVPGFIKTIRPSALQKDLCDQLTKEIPVERMGELSDITNAVSYLAGDLSKYVTGQAIRCDGGFDMYVTQ